MHEVIAENVPQVLSGDFQITCEKVHKKKNEKVPDVTNTVALIISSATRAFPSLKTVSENKFIAWEAECQTILTRAMKEYRS